jgi:hypothetical protein
MAELMAAGGKTVKNHGNSGLAGRPQDRGHSGTREAASPKSRKIGILSPDEREVAECVGDVSEQVSVMSPNKCR